VQARLVWLVLRRRGASLPLEANSLVY
jgi:hypothetical protein